MRSLFCGPRASLFLWFYRPLARLLLFLRKDPPKVPIPDSPRILICCFGSLGDVFLACSFLDLLQKAWPTGQISFLCESASIHALQEQTSLVRIHKVPCWMHQSKIRSLALWLSYSCFLYTKVSKEIKSCSYDISFDLHPFFPNALPIVRRARIPRRVAFATYGFDIWCTDPVPFPSSWNYLPLLYPLLLKPLHQKATLPLKPPRPPSQQGPIVIHIGTSDPRKEWSLVNWKKLILSLRQLPYPLLFTGRGKREQDHLAQLPILPGESLLDRQDFRSFSHTIKEAKLLISVDSVSVHLAARWQTPFVALYLYNETLDLWVPKVEYGRSLTHVPITPDQVLQAAKDLL